MPHEKLASQRELIRTISLDPPVIESFSDPIQAAEVWPESIAGNKVFLEQLKKRQELNERLDDVLRCLPRPDVSLDSAIDQGRVTEEQAAKLYESLSSLFEFDKDYKRLVLYLPFEFLPSSGRRPKGEALKNASGRFRKSYLAAWENLLSVHDVRANFVDGDVLEVGRRASDLPRVVKAAHLIPKLVENGLMAVEEVIALMEASDDQLLKDSIADTLPVLADLGLITAEELELMRKSEDRLVGNMARIIVLNMKAKVKQPETESKTITLPAIQEELRQEFLKADAVDYGDITIRRKDWLTRKKKQEIIEASGDDISVAIIKNSLADEVTAGFLTAEADTASQQALVEGIRKAVESVLTADPKKARALYEPYKEILLTLWNNNNPETREALAKTFRRFHRLGLADDSQFEELKIILPKLAGPFSENLKLMKKEMRDIEQMAASIESNPELSKLIYPAVLVFGSRLKGYGASNADIDLAVFVKPGASLGEASKLRALLKETFAYDRIRDEIIEFWLEEREDGFKVRDFTKPEASQGKSSWTYILFGAVWAGDKAARRELCEKLLARYLYDTGKTMLGRQARSVYLEELERDSLQYRLMHKGYEQFFPPCGGIQTPHADEIDGDSMFWDSGYRQLATKLYLSRVFLPKIPVAEK